MEFLISLYDNSLIYFPNVFFAALFLLSILVTVLTIKGIIYLNRELRKIVKKIKRDVGKIRINQIRIKKIKIDKNLSSANFIKKFIKSFKSVFKIIKIIFIKINATLQYLEMKTEKIFKKMGKEIFIEE